MGTLISPVPLETFARESQIIQFLPHLLFEAKQFAHEDQLVLRASMTKSDL